MWMRMDCFRRIIQLLIRKGFGSFFFFFSVNFGLVKHKKEES